MKKSNLKEVINIIKQNVQNEDVEMDIIDLPNNKIKHIIIGNKKTIQVKKQSSMTTKQFQEFVIEFIKEQKLVNQRQEETNKKQEIFNQQQLEFNKMIMQRLDNIENRLTNVENDIKLIKSCPTIKKELKDIS